MKKLAIYIFLINGNDFKMCFVLDVYFVESLLIIYISLIYGMGACRNIYAQLLFVVKFASLHK